MTDVSSFGPHISASSLTYVIDALPASMEAFKSYLKVALSYLTDKVVDLPW